MGELDTAVAADIAALLRRSPETFWSPAAVAHKLGIGSEVAERTLQRLAGAEVVVAAGHSSAFRYAPDRRS